MIRKFVLSAIAGALAVVCGFTATASAIEYGADLVIPGPDGTWQVHVEGLTPGATATVTLVCDGHSNVTLGTTTVESDGTIDEFYTLPSYASTSSCAIRVASGAISKSFAIGLPSTGSDPLSSMSIAAGLIAAGAVIAGASSLGRRRTARA